MRHIGREHHFLVLVLYASYSLHGPLSSQLQYEDERKNDARKKKETLRSPASSPLKKRPFSNFHGHGLFPHQLGPSFQPSWEMGAFHISCPSKRKEKNNQTNGFSLVQERGRLKGKEKTGRQSPR